MFRVVPFLVSLCLLFSTPIARAGAEGLFEQMVGIWAGQGERVQLMSGRRVRIEARAVAVIQGARLVSHNEISEFPESGPARHYFRDYWIQSSPSETGGFELGQNNQVTSQGRYVDGILYVEQELGGIPTYVIRSRTKFDVQESLYQETVWHGEQELARTSIRYRRRE